MIARAEASKNTRVVARQLAEREVTWMHEAADLAAFPYLASLNSGAAILAMGYGLPVVAPDLPAFSDLITPETGVLYSPDEGLYAALNRALGQLDAGV